ncbi:MAG: GGDEF domain-containing protein [Burkholderiales bacterium]|nr:GGDEF domain-containing protein [Burkholderiales bacterium]
MKHFNTIVDNIDQLTDFLALDSVSSAAKSARSILVQIYAGRLDQELIGKVIASLESAMPEAVIVGTTSAGEISQGRTFVESLLVSIAIFQSSNLQSVAIDCPSKGEYATGKAIAKAFSAIPDLQGILLLAPPTRINCAHVLEGIEQARPGTFVFGGGAADVLPDRRPRVFRHRDTYENGCVAIAFSGASLHIENHISLNWKPIGPRISLTDVDGFCIRAIDGKPALDVYRKYLGIGLDEEEIYLLEFPLLIERRDSLIARNPVSASEDGCVTLVADVASGETARLGYLDVDSVINDIDSVLQSLEAFSPEAIFIYSCICRRFTLQEDVDCETRPFQAAAPVAGFYTSGEFCRMNDQLQLLNSSQVMIAMREGSHKQTPKRTTVATLEEKDHYRFRHARITSRLFQFITALTEQVEQANQQLVYQAEHDGLTGALNRRALDAKIESELSRSERYGRTLAVVMFDLDHFKRFNDDFGHAAGDLVLKSVVAAVNQVMRGSDTLYRYGGEEFLLLLPEATIKGAVSVAEKARARIEAMNLSYDGQKLPTVTISLGVSCYPMQGKDSRSLIKMADAALYQSKEQGRNRVTVAE